jgi:negative regulator of flagellin synthesis FlgM
MSNKISGVVGTVVSPSERSTGAGRDATAGRAARKADATDEVQLTGAAQELRASVSDRLAVDSQRVDAVKGAIERNEYRADPANIANRLLDIEEQI